MARRRLRRRSGSGKRKGFLGRIGSIVTSPAGLVILGLGMFVPFLLGGKIQAKVQELATKVKGGA